MTTLEKVLLSNVITMRAQALYLYIFLFSTVLFSMSHWDLQMGGHKSTHRHDWETYNAQWISIEEWFGKSHKSVYHPVPLIQSESEAFVPYGGICVYGISPS